MDAAASHLDPTQGRLWVVPGSSAERVDGDRSNHTWSRTSIEPRAVPTRNPAACPAGVLPQVRAHCRDAEGECHPKRAMPAWRTDRSLADRRPSDKGRLSLASDRGSRCKVPSQVDLAALPHPSTTVVHDLAGRVRCQKCAKAGRPAGDATAT